MLLLNDVDELVKRQLFKGCSSVVGKICLLDCCGFVWSVMVQHWQQCVIGTVKTGQRAIVVAGIVSRRGHQLLDFVSDMRCFVICRWIGAAQNEVGLIDNKQVIIGP